MGRVGMMTEQLESQCPHQLVSTKISQRGGTSGPRGQNGSEGWGRAAVTKLVWLIGKPRPTSEPPATMGPMPPIPELMKCIGFLQEALSTPPRGQRTLPVGFSSDPWLSKSIEERGKTPCVHSVHTSCNWSNLIGPSSYH